MQKRMRIMLICLSILFGSIFIWKFISLMLFKRFIANHVVSATVSTMKVPVSPWQPQLHATGSLRAVKGVNVTTELAGTVQKIYFTPGSMVKEKTLLIQLDAEAELGQLQSLKAQAALSALTYKRDQAQYRIHAVSQQTVDADFQNWKSLLGQVAQQQAIVNKKSIRAPFSGRLGINNVNPGQYINPGDKIVSLQTMDQIYADFYMPQQALTQLRVGESVILTTDTFPHKIFQGKITTIDPAIDTTTRNVTIEATIANPTDELTPGMFATVNVKVGQAKNYLTLPQTAVSFNPYGNIVYVIRPTKDKTNASGLIARQVFVTTGESRGDQITILKGLKKDDIVVTSGQLKLKNNMAVTINNKILPTNNANPIVTNEY